MQLDEKRLQEIADVTGGFYVHLEKGPPEMAEIVRRGVNQLKETEGSTRLSREPIERYQWPLAASLLSLSATMFISERASDFAQRHQPLFLNPPIKMATPKNWEHA